MTDISKRNFVQRLQGASIEVRDVKEDTRIRGDIREAAVAADQNQDGQIKGERESEALFDRLDTFDRNGSRHSLRLQDHVKHILGHARSGSATPVREGSVESMGRQEFVDALGGKEIVLTDLLLRREIPGEVTEAAEAADLNGDGKLRGRTEHNLLFENMDKLDRNGDAHSLHHTPAVSSLLNSATVATPTPLDDGDELLGDFQLEVNEEAVRRGKRSGLGKKAAEMVPRYAEIYKEAAALTGVPATLIAALHGNESQFGTYSPSTRGPESGFGLDPRFVKTEWGQRHLDRYQLGDWQRGKDTEHAVLQSAVVAAQHLRRQATYAGVKVQGEMTQGALAGAVTSYVQGIRAGRNAARNGESWLLRPSEENPHPLHPGGTSIGRFGQTIRVAPARKEGLLRWDVLLPIVREHM